MNIEATCGCGARVTLTPLTRKASYGHDQVPDADERTAVTAAFEKWVETHAACSRPERVTYPSRYYDKSPPEREPELEPTEGTA